MKNRKHTIVLFLLALFIFGALSGCGYKGRCENCGRYESLKKFYHFYGDVSWYCEACYEKQTEMQQAMRKAFN